MLLIVLKVGLGKEIFSRTSYGHWRYCWMILKPRGIWLLVCTWRKGGLGGGPEKKHFSSLGTKSFIHVNSSRKRIVLNPNMAALSRGCKPRIREGSTLRTYPRPCSIFDQKSALWEDLYKIIWYSPTVRLFEIFSIKALLKSLNNGTFSETKPQVSQRQFRNPRSGSPAVYVL